MWFKRDNLLVWHKNLLNVKTIRSLVYILISCYKHCNGQEKPVIKFTKWV